MKWHTPNPTYHTFYGILPPNNYTNPSKSSPVYQVIELETDNEIILNQYCTGMLLPCHR